MEGFEFYQTHYPFTRTLDYLDTDEHGHYTYTYTFYYFDTSYIIGCDNCVYLWKSEENKNEEEIDQLKRKQEKKEADELRKKNTQKEEIELKSKQTENREERERSLRDFDNLQNEDEIIENNILIQENNILIEEINLLSQEMNQLTEENNRFKQENIELKEEVLGLKSKVSELETKNENFMTKKQQLLTEFDSLYQKNEIMFEFQKKEIESELININNIISDYNIIEEKQLNESCKLTPELLLQNTEHLHEFTCFFCTNIVDSPVECEKCEKIYCGDCIYKYTLQQKNECPNCKETPFKSQKLPRIARDILGNSKFTCPFKCGEIFEYYNKQKHITSCKNIKLIYKCNLCSSILPMEEGIKDQHKLKCEKLIAICPYCKEEIIKFYYESHLNKCHKSYIHCKECNINISFDFQDSHKKFFCNEIKNFLKSVSILIYQLQQV